MSPGYSPATRDPSTPPTPVRCVSSKPGDLVEHRQDFGLATFVADRYPVVGRLSEFVYGTFADHERWPSNGRPRLAQGLRLLDRARERFVCIVQLHGLRDTSGKGDTPARIDQAERVVALVERRTSNYTKPTRHANYVLVSERVPVDQLDIPAQPEVSDHRPLILDIN